MITSGISGRLEVFLGTEAYADLFWPEGLSRLEVLFHDSSISMYMFVYKRKFLLVYALIDEERKQCLSYAPSKNDCGRVFVG